MSSILEIPDEPKRSYRGPVPAAAIAVVLIVGGVVAARTFAVGGWQRPWLSVGMVTSLPALAVAWLVTGDDQRRTLVAAAAAVVGVAVIPIASAGATPSPARLSAIANAIKLPGRVTHETRLGDGRCRTACSEIRRTALVTGISFKKAYVATITALKGAGYETKEFARAPGAPAVVHAAKGKILVQLELRAGKDGSTRVASIFLADGPTPDTSVG